MDAALTHYGVDVAGCTALDAGLSTGGFADCLLQRGAAQVYGVDVGHAQVIASDQFRGGLAQPLTIVLCVWLNLSAQMTAMNCASV